MGLDPGFLKLVAEKYNFKVSFNLYVEKFTFSITEEPVVGSDPHLVNKQFLSMRDLRINIQFSSLILAKQTL